MRQQRVRKSMSIVRAAGLLALATAATAQAQNLLLNPGFEAPPAPGNTSSEIAGWTVINDAARATFFNNTPGGSWSLWAKTFQPAGGGASQTVSGISPGANYNLTSQLLFEEFYPTTEAIIQLGLTWLDAGNNPVGSPNFTNIQPSSVTQTGVWLPFSVMGTAPVGATQVQVFLGWMDGGTVKGAQSAFFDDAVLEGPGQPPTGSTWAVNGSGNWNHSASWANGIVPNAVGAEAIFGGIITSPQTVFTNSPVTVGAMSFNNANTYVIAGAGSLTLQVDTGNATISVQSGSHKINLPTRFASDTNITVAGGAALNLADPVTIAANRTVNTAGNVTISAPLTIETGGGLGIGSNARLFGAPSLGTGAKVDIKNNSVVVDYNPGASPLQTIRMQVASGFNGGSWNGQGIISSNGNASTHGVGYAEASAIFSSFPATFAGMSVDDTTVLLRFTRYGDANLDGVVNLQDFNRLAGNFGSSNAVWSQGDFNYDGLVNLQDFNRLAANFGLQAGPEGPTPDDWSALASAVPEPASMSLVGLCAVALAHRRRRVA